MCSTSVATASWDLSLVSMEGGRGGNETGKKERMEKGFK